MWITTTYSSRSNATISSSMPRSSLPIQTRRASAVAVAVAMLGLDRVDHVHRVDLADPMTPCRAAHRSSRSTWLLWHTIAQTIPLVDPKNAAGGWGLVVRVTAPIASATQATQLIMDEAANRQAKVRSQAEPGGGNPARARR